MAISPDGKRILRGSGGSNDKTGKSWGEMKVWDAASGKEKLSLKGHNDAVTSVAIGPDGWALSAMIGLDDKRIVSGSQDGTVKVWHAP